MEDLNNLSQPVVETAPVDAEVISVPTPEMFDVLRLWSTPEALESGLRLGNAHRGAGNVFLSGVYRAGGKVGDVN